MGNSKESRQSCPPTPSDTNYTSQKTWTDLSFLPSTCMQKGWAFCSETFRAVLCVLWRQQWWLTFYLYVGTSASSLPASRNSFKALIASWLLYHKWGWGKEELVSWRKNLLFRCIPTNVCLCIVSVKRSWLFTDGSQSGNSTM